MMNRIIAPDFYYQQDLDQIKKRKDDEIESLLRKVEVYRSKGEKSSYSIPLDVEYLLNFDDEGKLRDEVTAIIEKQYKGSMKQIEDRNRKIRTKEIPEFLRAVTHSSNL